VRPKLEVAGSRLQLNGDESLKIDVDVLGHHETFSAAIPGIYNAYNVLAAVAAANAMGVDVPVMLGAVERFQPAFGRIERLRYLDRQLTIALVKNPVGFNEVLRMLTQDGALATPTMIVINDLDADSRDVSWLWDVDFELLEGDGPIVATAGIRGTDMANRLKYAGVAPDRILPLGEDLSDALTAFVDRVPAGTTAWILPTYTAMLGTRKELVNRGAVDDYWK
jgi:UDP-N-acetylmuramyl tripeptide synthase